MAALAASSLPKSASHDDLAALSISKSASDGAMASPGLARAQSFASTPSLASLAGPPAPPLELEERDAASGLKYVRCMLGAGAAADAPEPPVVFFAHGCAMNAGAWRGALAALHAALCDGGRRLEAVAVDLPGHGRSPAAPVAPAGGGAPPGPDGGGGGAWRGVARALLDVLGEVLGVVLGVVIATLGALRATRFGDPPPWMPLREVLAGGVAAATTEIALYPVEVFKVRRQTGGAGKLPLLTTAGLAAGVLRGLCYHGLRLGLFPAVKNALGGDSLVARIASGAACGALGAALCNPLDLVKTRLQRDPERYPNSFAALVAVFKGGGAFVGSPATVLRAAAGSAAQLATYDSVKGAALASELPAALAVPVAVCCSSVAYCTAAAPMDVVKARLMVARDGDRSGVLACVRDLARTGGPAAFFKGWLPAVLRLLPVALFVFPARPRAETFDAMEALRAFLGAAAY
ncbi:hypothetical protein AURANDRAFT_66373 [Aureococcus anophagefferens]|uniref:Mitochondrial carrier protein n=1 Tax=Aureococcus anophagefferens TaxID=44056 RepID=F0YHB1_AURAN|nr:hypothetical protein AURANDRAFT_66373 [Aureococcus anophagefferens]EGB05505.1 hypothetical protein AURANDRAFT_66373 [Aureococcus anophagefferens]|eukprot:XP_009039886.1 hypothetical protein AURANDRAFT_66373 [Aureococcus anophagefferens]